MTEEATPTPMPAPSATGSSNAFAAPKPPIGVIATAAISIAAASPSIRSRAALRETRVREHDVDREQGGVGEREGDAERRGREPDVGEDVDAGNRQCECDAVAAITDAQGGEQDHRQELDRGDGAQRQSVDREVEDAVHRKVRNGIALALAVPGVYVLTDARPEEL